MQEHINTQLLDEELAKLKAIGLKELSKTTKLASSKIEDVLEKRFDKIDKVRAKGFIAILEREYDVDLRDWILLWQEMQKDNVMSVSQVISKQDEEERAQRLADNANKIKQKEKEKEIQKNEQKNREHQVLNLALKDEPTSKSDTESYTWLYVILAIILIALMGYFAYKAFMQDHDDTKPKVPQTTQPNADSNANEDNNYDGLFFDPTKSQQTAQTDEIQAEESTQTTNDDLIQNPPLKEDKNQIEQNFFFNPQATTQAEESIQTQQTAQNQQIKDDILHIISSYDLWLGVINLNTGSKEQFSGKKEYDIKLNHKMLFVMGHSNFKIMLNGEEISHNTKYPVRMYYDGNTLKDINYTTFKQLNGGVEW